MIFTSKTQGKESRGEDWELPASLCLPLALFLSGSISLSAWVCPAGHHSFQTSDSLFLGILFFNASLYFTFDPIWLFLFFLQKGNKFPVNMSVSVCVCTRACVACQ